MWKTLSDWLPAFLNMAREMESVERDKLMLRFQQELAGLKEPPSARGRKNG